MHVGVQLKALPYLIPAPSSSPPHLRYRQQGGGSDGSFLLGSLFLKSWGPAC